MNSVSLTSSEQILLPISLFLLAIILVLAYASRRISRAEAQAVSDSVTGALNSNGMRRAAEKYLLGQRTQYAVIVMELRNYRQLKHTFGTENCNSRLH